jgi:hypothetical protein
MDGQDPGDRNAVLRARILLAVLAVGIGLLLLLIATRPVVPLAPVVAPSPTASLPLPPAVVQGVADRIRPQYDGVLRVDRKVIVQLGDVDRRDSPGIPGATDGTWAIAIVGEIAQTWGLLPTGNSQCAIWFVNSAGFAFASQRGALSKCDPYVSR